MKETGRGREVQRRVAEWVLPRARTGKREAGGLRWERVFSGRTSLADDDEEVVVVVVMKVLTGGERLRSRHHTGSYGPREQHESR